jgi:hypothetical protein
VVAPTSGWGSLPVVLCTLHTSPDSPAVELAGVPKPASVAGDWDTEPGVRLDAVEGRSGPPS